MSKSATPAKLDLVLEPDDAQRLVNLCGPFDAHLRQIELRLGIEIRTRGNRFQLVRARKAIGRGEAALPRLFKPAAAATVTPENVHPPPVHQPVTDDYDGPETGNPAGA